MALPPKPDTVVSHSGLQVSKAGYRTPTTREVAEPAWVRVDGRPNAHDAPRRHRLELTLTDRTLTLTQMDKGELWSLPVRRVTHFEHTPTAHVAPGSYAVIAHTEQGGWWYVIEELSEAEGGYVAAFLNHVRTETG